MESKFQRLIQLLKHLPGVGDKSATRFAITLLNKDEKYLLELSEIIKSIALENWKCKKCFNIADNDGVCNICRDMKRDETIICVVANVSDLIAIEKTGEFTGKYHVIENLINPINGVFPEHTTINELINRVLKDNVKELILALPATTDGDTTAQYIKHLLKEKNIKITKLARGVPVGNSLDNIDNITLVKSLNNRTPF